MYPPPHQDTEYSRHSLCLCLVNLPFKPELDTILIYLYHQRLVLSVLFFAVASGGHSSSRCAGLSLSRPLLLWSTGSRGAGSVIVAHGPSRSAACGILPDQGSNPCPLHWQADSQPLRHQGSPCFLFLSFITMESYSFMSIFMYSFMFGSVHSGLCL